MGKHCRTPEEALARMREYSTVTPEGCRLWTAATNKGYGAFRFLGRIRTAHRLYWELSGLPLKSYEDLDHDGENGCHTSLCIEPAHLEAVMPDVNKKRPQSPRSGYLAQRSVGLAISERVGLFRTRQKADAYIAVHPAPELEQWTVIEVARPKKEVTHE